MTRGNHSTQRYRWVAAALLLVKQHMHKIQNFKQILKMQKSNQRTTPNQIFTLIDFNCYVNKERGMLINKNLLLTA